MRRLHRLLLAAAVLSLCVGCDRLTKDIAVEHLKSVPTRSFLADVFRLTYAENPGAFLGLGGRMHGTAQFWVLTVGVGVLLLAMLVLLFVSPKLNAVATAGLAMLVGGGLSNWVDRVVNDGRVVDFMNLGIGSLRSGIFNVADLAIMGGAALLVLSGIKRPPERATSAQPPAPPSPPASPPPTEVS
ncbi:MAG: signal peptidase II [Myxococcaceae bacterium]|nr:signal peptidase II [Myxococcaceae bacterium]